jgi:hypothetical protein
MLGKKTEAGIFSCPLSDGFFKSPSVGQSAGMYAKTGIVSVTLLIPELPDARDCSPDEG